MKTKPAISVIIPNYNYAHYLGECMQSVIDQTFTDWEMIVVDDGSTDNSKEVVEVLYAGAHFHLGDIYQTQGKLKEAKHEFEFCLNLTFANRL